MILSILTGPEWLCGDMLQTNSARVFFVLAPPSFAFLLHCKGYVALGGHGCLSRLDRKEHSDGLGPDMGQNAHQEAHSEHFGCLAPDMARMGLRRLILRTLAAWAQI